MQTLDSYTKNKVRGTTTFRFLEGIKLEYDQTAQVALYCTCPEYLRVYACSHVCEVEYMAQADPHHDAFRKDVLNRFEQSSTDSEASMYETETTDEEFTSGVELEDSEPQDTKKAASQCCTLV